MSWILSEQIKTDKGWIVQDSEYETEDEAVYQGRCDQAADICKWFEVYHS